MSQKPVQPSDDTEDEARGPGRPTDYDPKFIEQAKKLTILGATDQEIADFFEVNVRTIYRWKVSFPEFSQALNIGKAEADERVKRSLFQRAIGYEQEEVKIFMPAGATEPVYAPFRAKIAPDTTACIFWLKNRDKANWRDRIDHANDPDNPMPTPTVTVKFERPE